MTPPPLPRPSPEVSGERSVWRFNVTVCADNFRPVFLSTWEWVYASNLPCLQRVTRERETSKRHLRGAHIVLITAILLPQRFRRRTALLHIMNCLFYVDLYLQFLYLLNVKRWETFWSPGQVLASREGSYSVELISSQIYRYSGLTSTVGGQSPATAASVAIQCAGMLFASELSW
jgi:hypothetical protein